MLLPREVLSETGGLSAMLNHVLTLLTAFKVISGTHNVQFIIVVRHSIVAFFLLGSMSANGLCMHKDLTGAVIIKLQT